MVRSGDNIGYSEFMVAKLSYYYSVILSSTGKGQEFFNPYINVPFLQLLTSSVNDLQPLRIFASVIILFMDGPVISMFYSKVFCLKKERQLTAYILLSRSQ